MSDRVRAALAAVVEGKRLSMDEARGAMGSVMDGEATQAQLAALLVAQSLAERWGLAGAATGRRGLYAGLALGLTLAGFLWRLDYRNKPHYAGRCERAYQIAIEAMRPGVPPDAVIAAIQAS